MIFFSFFCFSGTKHFFTNINLPLSFVWFVLFGIVIGDIETGIAWQGTEGTFCIGTHRLIVHDRVWKFGVHTSQKVFGLFFFFLCLLDSGCIIIDLSGGRTGMIYSCPLS